MSAGSGSGAERQPEPTSGVETVVDDVGLSRPQSGAVLAPGHPPAATDGLDTRGRGGAPVRSVGMGMCRVLRRRK